MLGAIIGAPATGSEPGPGVFIFRTLAGFAGFGYIAWDCRATRPKPRGYFAVEFRRIARTMPCGAAFLVLVGIIGLIESCSPR